VTASLMSSRIGMICRQPMLGLNVKVEFVFLGCLIGLASAAAHSSRIRDGANIWNF